MKRGFFILIILFVYVFVLTACSNNDADRGSESEEETNTPTNNENSEDEYSIDNESSEEGHTNAEENSPEIVLENEAFRIYQPAPNSDVSGDFIVSGLARVWEGNIIYEFEDGHFILDEGFTTATVGAPEWGEFEFTIKLDEERNYSGRVVIYEESAKDGSRLHELLIPVNVVE